MNQELQNAAPHPTDETTFSTNRSADLDRLPQEPAPISFRF